MKRFYTILFSILFLSCITALASGIPSRPQPQRLVNDYAGIITPNAIPSIERMLVAFDDSTSTQICVVTLDDLDGYSAAEMAYEIGQQWGVGHNGKNNGIVMLVKPKNEHGSGQAFIATGYGLEGALPDAICTRIVNTVMIPHFRENDYTQGISEGLVYIMKYVSGEYTQDNTDDDDTSLTVIIALFIVFVIIITLFSNDSNNRGDRGRHITNGSDAAWIIGSILNSASHHGGSYGGGSFGGGFGGFGGGSFGGGGGGGSW